MEKEWCFIYSRVFLCVNSLWSRFDAWNREWNTSTKISEMRTNNIFCFCIYFILYICFCYDMTINSKVTSIRIEDEFAMLLNLPTRLERHSTPLMVWWHIDHPSIVLLYCECRTETPETHINGTNSPCSISFIFSTLMCVRMRINKYN